MNESASMGKLKREAKQKELERKAENTRREQIYQEITKHVRLTKAIYIEPLASQKPIVEEVKTFDVQEKCKNLEELKAALQFL